LDASHTSEKESHPQPDTNAAADSPISQDPKQARIYINPPSGQVYPKNKEQFIRCLPWHMPAIHVSIVRMSKPD
jgi:hypothetical protein